MRDMTPMARLGLQKGIIYGPVDSRRFGRSLGVNLLSSRSKICTMDCRYCQYGWTRQVAAGWQALPSEDEVVEAATQALVQLRSEGIGFDAVTLAGNGEPTLHPRFPTIVERLGGLRDEWAPGVPLVVLSNSTTISRPAIRQALRHLDVRCMKLDAGRPELFERLNQPIPAGCWSRVIEGLQQLGGVTVQAMFVTGAVDNTVPEEVSAWLACLRRIRLLEVQLFSLDRAPADPALRPVDPARLAAIAQEVRDQLGVPAYVF